MMKMTRKEYQKPFMVVEKFVAQEYCAICEWTNVTQSNIWNSATMRNYKYRYVDLNENGEFDAGEQFLASTGRSTTSVENQSTTKTISIARLRKDPPRNTNPEYEPRNISNLNGQLYTESVFSVENQNCTFAFTSTKLRFKVLDNVLYYATKIQS